MSKAHTHNQNIKWVSDFLRKGSRTMWKHTKKSTKRSLEGLSASKKSWQPNMLLLTFSYIRHASPLLPERRIFLATFMKASLRSSKNSINAHGWPHQPKILVWTCRKLNCLTIYNKLVSSLSFFVRFLRNPTIGLAKSILV